jgi:hypothetical protein
MTCICDSSTFIVTADALVRGKELSHDVIWSTELIVIRPELSGTNGAVSIIVGVCDGDGILLRLDTGNDIPAVFFTCSTTFFA